jgi:hypothetical protein
VADNEGLHSIVIARPAGAVKLTPPDHGVSETTLLIERLRASATIARGAAR